MCSSDLKDPPRDAAEGRAHGEGEQLHPRRVDAHGACRDLVLAHRLPGAADARVLQAQVDEDHREQHHEQQVVVLDRPAEGEAEERIGAPEIDRADIDRVDARDAARWMAANLAPGLVMAHLNQGPLLLYWTPHSVVSGPYHRNRAGIRDGFAFFASEDDRSAKRIVAERGVDYVLICPGEDRAAAKIERSLANRLEAGQPPSWLRTVALPGSRFMLYRVLR